MLELNICSLLKGCKCKIQINNVMCRKPNFYIFIKKGLNDQAEYSLIHFHKRLLGKFHPDEVIKRKALKLCPCVFVLGNPSTSGVSICT